MTEWRYLFPTLADVPSDLFPTRVGLRLADPRVSLFCLGNPVKSEGGTTSDGFSHQATPWLFGSFEPLYDYLERTGAQHWSLLDTYPAGDGGTVRLEQGRRSTQYLDNDRPVDDVSAQFLPSVRGRYKFKCGHCDLSGAWQSETLQMPLTLLACRQLREVSLLAFARAVAASQRAARARRC